MRHKLIILLVGIVIGFGCGYLVFKANLFSGFEFLSPVADSGLLEDKIRPLQQYSFDQLSQRPLVASNLSLDRILEDNSNYTSYLFSFITTGKKMTGQLNIPKNVTKTSPVIIMIRGYVDPDVYETGTGTKNAASVFAQNGFVTIAPDFLGFGESDNQPEDAWEARFIKPVNILELVKSLIENSVLDRTGPEVRALSKPFDPEKIGIWAHSNGGQIAISVLEILSKPIPTSMWAPVTVPFPYSVLYFSDELEDEGKVQRAWVAMFERKYDAADFSITKHLSKLTAPLQIHHGTNDDAALKWWSDEFVEKLEAENDAREQLDPPRPPIEFEYFTYPGADHNLRPAWNTAVKRDLNFYKAKLQQ